MKTTDFELTFIQCGMGSNMGSMMPTLRVSGTEFTYTSEQNSFYGKPDKAPKAICSGNFRTTAVDSIVNLMKTTDDTLIYKTNINVMSGSINYIFIEAGDLKRKFTSHNASDPLAEKIVAILNSHIPADKEKIGIFDISEFKIKIEAETK